LEKIERKGKGWNLTLQVLDGILCHDGEVHNQAIKPNTDKDFQTFDTEVREKGKTPSMDILPMSLEGCVVRMADTISYIGRDIEDAIRLGLIERSELPEDSCRLLGNTNGTIVYTLVEDLVIHSLDKPYACFSPEVGAALKGLKQFNQDHIYMSGKVKEQTPKIRLMFEMLFEKYLDDLQKGNEDSDAQREYLEGMASEYREQTSPAEIVRDFIAGMTDEYFLDQCQKHLIPQVKSTRF
jgi:dGTPase